ncbi:RNA polymerase Rpc34 subunit-domain-containing protein [Phakopsora pachyrhizi]|nr:RNA polymerase Rpc34 subunit-domain-containing protein [Phakopsora pachyrhizi]
MPPRGKQSLKDEKVENGGSGVGSQPSNKLSKDEKELFMRCIKAEQRTLSHEELQAAMPNLDVVQKMSIANSLIARGMLQIKRLDNELFYTAIDKSQQKLNSTLGLDEKLIYDNIVSSGNTGIWTKTLKMRTNLHQTNINKALKSLENKNLIKAVKSVKFPTRKIYMLFELQPSTELSGGPWYTDSELDTEFIGVLLRSIHQYLQERSYPIPKSSSTSTKALLYPTSHTPYLPTTVHDILAYLKQSQIVQEGTDLSTEHIVTLLDVLLFDGSVERITVGTAKCEAQDDDDDDDDDHLRSGSEEGDEESSGLEEDHRKKKRSGKKSTDSRNPKKQKTIVGGKTVNRKKKLRFEDSFNGHSDSQEDVDREDEDEDEDDEEMMMMMRMSSKRSKRGRRVIPVNEAFVYRALRPLEDQPQSFLNDEDDEESQRSKIDQAPTVSGFYDMPCGHCPSFEFCSSKGKSWQFRGINTLGGNHKRPGMNEKLQRLPKLGLAGIGSGFSSVGGLGRAGGVAPVNPADCVYFTEWLEF